MLGLVDDVAKELKTSEVGGDWFEIHGMRCWALSSDAFDRRLICTAPPFFREATAGSSLGLADAVVFDGTVLLFCNDP